MKRKGEKQNEQEGLDNNMTSDSLELAIQRVRDYCKSIINNKGCPSDDHVEVCEEILKIINETLKK